MGKPWPWAAAPGGLNSSDCTTDGLNIFSRKFKYRTKFSNSVKRIRTNCETRNVSFKMWIENTRVAVLRTKVEKLMPLDLKWTFFAAPLPLLCMPVHGGLIQRVSSVLLRQRRRIKKITDLVDNRGMRLGRFFVHRSRPCN